jgi:hypothetical protein
MRRQDKKIAIQKANLLLEQRNIKEDIQNDDTDVELIDYSKDKTVFDFGIGYDEEVNDHKYIFKVEIDNNSTWEGENRAQTHWDPAEYAEYMVYFDITRIFICDKETHKPVRELNIKTEMDSGLYGSINDEIMNHLQNNEPERDYDGPEGPDDY